MYGVKIPEELADYLREAETALQFALDVDGDHWPDARRLKMHALLGGIEGVLERFRKEQKFHQDREQLVMEHDAEEEF
jgi:hypothetical protein